MLPRPRRTGPNGGADGQQNMPYGWAEIRGGQNVAAERGEVLFAVCRWQRAEIEHRYTARVADLAPERVTLSTPRKTFTRPLPSSVIVALFTAPETTPESEA